MKRVGLTIGLLLVILLVVNCSETESLVMDEHTNELNCELADFSVYDVLTKVWVAVEIGGQRALVQNAWVVFHKQRHRATSDTVRAPFGWRGYIWYEVPLPDSFWAEAWGDELTRVYPYGQVLDGWSGVGDKKWVVSSANQWLPTVWLTDDDPD